jgi:hypothetical protein
MGHVDTTIHCNIPTYACFLKGNKRTYIAFNPAIKPLTVTFSDNKKMTLNELEIKADTLSVSSDSRKQKLFKKKNAINKTFMINLFSINTFCYLNKLSNFKKISIYNLQGKKLVIIKKGNFSISELQHVFCNKIGRSIYILEVTN